MGIHPYWINDFLFIRNWIRIFLPSALRNNNNDSDAEDELSKLMKKLSDEVPNSSNNADMKKMEEENTFSLGTRKVII